MGASAAIAAIPPSIAARLPRQQSRRQVLGNSYCRATQLRIRKVFSSSLSSQYEQPLQLFLHYRHQHRCFSSIDTPANGSSSAGTTSAITTTMTTTTTQRQNRPLFPWRSEGLENLVPRITPDTVEFQTLIPLAAPEEVLVHVFLGETFWNSCVTKSYRQEWQEGMSFAFAQAVAGIVSNVYQVPFQQIVTNDKNDKVGDAPKFDVSFHYTPKPQTNKEPTDDAADHGDDKPNQKTTTTTQEVDPHEYCPQVQDMMIQPLRQLFQSAHQSGANQLKIQLQLKPKEAWFHRIYGMPFVTKQSVLDQPDTLQRILVNPSTQQLDPKFSQIFQLLQEASSKQFIQTGRFETTLVAEVLILCDEVFAVWDATTGELLQGHASSSDGGGKVREVAHLVTFERTSYTTESGLLSFPKIESLSNWQIADIDDLLGPKKWFHVEIKNNRNQTPPPPPTSTTT